MRGEGAHKSIRRRSTVKSPLPPGWDPGTGDTEAAGEGFSSAVH